MKYPKKKGWLERTLCNKCKEVKEAHTSQCYARKSISVSSEISSELLQIMQKCVHLNILAHRKSKDLYIMFFGYSVVLVLGSTTMIKGR